MSFEISEDKEYKKYLDNLEEILNSSTGSTTQRKLYNKSKDFKNVIRALIEQFYQ